jgi:hypothetical protein
MVVDHDRRNVESPQNTSKGHPMEIHKSFVEGLGCQVQCKVKINFVEVQQQCKRSKSDFFFHVKFSVSLLKLE